MRVCSECKILKAPGAFNMRRASRDGLAYVCKECRAIYGAARYAVHGDRLRKNGRAKARAGIRSKGTRKNVLKNQRRWKEKNKGKVKAQNKAWWAIKKGILKRLPCEVCGEIKVDAHHDDYSKPLEVRWLCKKCHGKTRRKYADDNETKIIELDLPMQSVLDTIFGPSTYQSAAHDSAPTWAGSTSRAISSGSLPSILGGKKKS